MKILCVFGKYQYGDPSRGIGTEYAAFLPALKRLGHEVIHFESWNQSLYRDYADLNRTLLETVERERPDILLSVQMNYEIWLETLQIIRARGDVATICWATDDSWKYREVSRFLGSAYHAIATTYHQVLPKYHNDGMYNVILTQWAANTDTLREPLSASSCRYLVSFIGAAYGNRKQRVKKLKSLGLDVSCFGHGWPSGSIKADEIPRIIRESVISLNFANSKGQNQIKARTFEVPGAGGFLLTEWADGLDRYYTPGREIAIFRTLDELADKIRYYLTHRAERDAIARASYERTREEHTYEKRLSEVLDFVLRQQKEYFARRSTSPTDRIDWDKFEEAVQRHRMDRKLLFLKRVLVAAHSAIWGQTRGPRAARRLVFEISWRLTGARTFSAAGWPGRMFYDV